MDTKLSVQTSRWYIPGNGWCLGDEVGKLVQGKVPLLFTHLGPEEDNG